MKINFIIFFEGVLIFAIAFFTSCENSSDELSEIVLDRQEAISTAWNIRMVYSDSIKIKAILSAPRHVDYTNLSFRYAEFPEGLKVIFYDDLERENQVVADYGILYDDTKLIDLKGNVRLQSHDGSVLTTTQLFWDLESEWLFTEKPFRFEDSDYNFEALRLDTNKEFTKFQTGSLIGSIKVPEEKDTLEQK